MMTYFLTSSSCTPGLPSLNPANGFVAELKKALKKPVHALFITSAPDDVVFTDSVAISTRENFANSGIVFDTYNKLDRRNAEKAEEFVKQANLIVLSGDHTPTENFFFAGIHLKELLQDYDGVLVGISAGSMNSAEVVYAQPEEAGETLDPDFEKFLPGLGLTQIQIIPHYQMIKDYTLDGKKLFEEVTYPDSMGHTFYALVDGSFLFGKDGREELRGEIYEIKDGVLTQIGKEGDVLVVK